MEGALQLPMIDLSSTDRTLLADSLRKACVENGFFYLRNHGIGEELIQRVFEGSRRFFGLSLEEKMKLLRKNHRGYSPLYSEMLNSNDNPKGDPKESIYFGAPEDISPYGNLNQWPPQEVLPCWRSTMEEYYKTILCVGKRVVSLMAVALNVDEDFFEKVGAFDPPAALLRPLRYPTGEIDSSDKHMHGAGAHTDCGMITILVTDGVPGLQVCRDKLQKPQIWEDVHHLKGAFIVNIGDMMERWTNCLFKSTLHRVTQPTQERYSVAMLFDPSPDCVVECLKSCCNESSPPRFPPVRAADYHKENYKVTYGDQ
ncbi:2-oxoglutarate-Fe(II) type oxidoreductase hxnY-like isoform X2 [Nicotiana sylvestris]|uniref:Probable iron/ascorbate oxidoreductase DDB_G0283291 isoform X2 n=1 Tax=Nicotiana sylvestris TaxID=4096 RepID=A0A1U7VD85_NICSY|nr:PREDICTED: probable iron/ascorbate oxidoreductase DDB_G0283291 isoform X2 [Nicotiana sylvestris]